MRYLLYVLKYTNTPIKKKKKKKTTTLLLAYHIFEFTTGLYYPSISSLKADAIPEETRAAVMTLLRIPMNLGVGLIMWHVSIINYSKCSKC